MGSERTVKGPRRYVMDRMTLVALLCMLLFGTSFWGLVIVLERIPPVTLGLLRAFLVSAFMISLFYIMGRFKGRKWMMRGRNLLTAGLGGKRGFATAISLAIFSTVLPNIFQNVGMTMMDPGSTSSLTALIQGVSPVFTIILAVIILNERLGIWKMTVLLVAIPATAVLTTYGSEGIDLDSRETLGAFLNLLTALSYSVSGLILKHAMNRGAKPIHLVSVNAMYATLILFPIALFTWMMGWEEPTLILGSGIHVWLALFYVSVGLYGITAFIWYGVIRSGELSRVTFFVFLLPVFSYLMGFVLLGERLDAIQLLAGGVLHLGVGISQMGRKKVIICEPD